MTRIDPAAVETRLEELGRLALETAGQVREPAREYAEAAIATLEAGGRLLFCGNGGSAATVEHIATEYVIRLKRERRPLPAIALTACTAQLTAAANDYGYDQVFARAIRAFGGEGDLLVAHSTSGESENLLVAVREASARGLRTVGLLGRDGGRLAPLVDLPILVKSDDTARVQELHLAIEHAVADLVDIHFSSEGMDR